MQAGTADFTPENILHALNARLLDNTGNWATNLKIMVIFHRFLKEKTISQKTAKNCKKLCITLQNYVKSKGKESKGNFIELCFYKLSQDVHIKPYYIDDRLRTQVSKNYSDYLQAVISVVSGKLLTYFPKDYSEAESVVSSFGDKDLLSVIDLINGLIERIEEQLGFKSFGSKIRLYQNYLQLLFDDMIRLYNVYHIAIQKLLSKFKNLNSNKKAEAFKHYEKFLEFNRGFKSQVKSVPLMLNIKAESPKLYQENAETTMKLKKIMKSNKAMHNMDNFEDWEEEAKEQNLSEEYDFDQL